ncbi:MAG: SpoIVB peptidase, partial [Clostridia bacterium]|nr:SpoIVB peptidase [Clostridia bacterium]
NYKHSNKPIPIAFKQDVKEGKAKILCSIDEKGPKEYDIEIIKVYKAVQKSTKNMLIKIIDPVLLEKTGGIVQGMSGSPILQNGKLVGAVTHVLINEPEKGYGIFIENMLDDE